MYYVNQIKYVIVMQIKIKLIIKSIEDMEHLSLLMSKNLSLSYCLILCGNIGAGKTKFAKTNIKYLLNDSVSRFHSPTFNVISKYKSKKKTAVYHIDYYKMSKSFNNYMLKILNIIERKKGVFISEWSSNLKNQYTRLNVKSVKLNIFFVKDSIYGKIMSEFRYVEIVFRHIDYKCKSVILFLKQIYLFSQNLWREDLNL